MLFLQRYVSEPSSSGAYPPSPPALRTQDLQVLLTEFSHTCSMEISRPPDTSYNDLDTYNDTYRKCMDPNGSDLPGDYPLRPSSIATRRVRE